MTAWARLTWQAAAPAVLAAGLRRRLGVRPLPGEHGTYLVPLGGVDLEVRHWAPETAGDRPHRGGRLVFEPAQDGAPHPTLDPAPPAILVAVGWATVELDRAEQELEPWLGPVAAADRAGTATGRDVAEPLLGAVARVRGAPDLPGARLVLLEPVTEGRLAASLARDGEGPCALYLTTRHGPGAGGVSGRDGRGAFSGPAVGPLGPARLALGGPVAGPHLLLLEPAAARPERGVD